MNKWKESPKMEIRKRKSTGRPPIGEATKSLVIRLYNEDKMTCADIAKACNISRSSLFNIINERKKEYGNEEEI